MGTLLLFELDQLRLALPLEQVRETVRAVQITPLAGAPGVVEGIVDVHGTVAPVLDLRARLRLPPRPVAISDHMIVAHTGARLVVLRVDQVLAVHTLPLTAAPAAEPAYAHLAGVARLEDGMVLVYDLEAFLTQGEQALLEVALTPGAGAGPTRNMAGGNVDAGPPDSPEAVPPASP